MYGGCNFKKFIKPLNGPRKPKYTRKQPRVQKH